ncbi:helix-turn-helix domain-containing protein [Zunongwangia sp. SCSIO 43204]|uniref:helix-turn-helix transcriptional regulator n=1 Tax=Zunongwangia sp. SCSIO 43204 TaxID=2779359 RepID=UPI001CA9257F|nr:helix-turn-helix domain-containing protein [Zunongwangia sp. SCSIO 43204]UAB82866.1 helix-turn-helix domain-containing protein [Zunongwangia sp. SCSIO 43204]
MENQLILEKLNRLEKLIVGSTKEILTVEDLINYTGYKRSYIYKLVHNNVIPFSKPNGKTLFFEKSEIDSWLLQNKSQSESQIEDKAKDYINTRKK